VSVSLLRGGCPGFSIALSLGVEVSLFPLGGGLLATVRFGSGTAFF
jgi:hypothetical protein